MSLHPQQGLSEFAEESKVEKWFIHSRSERIPGAGEMGWQKHSEIHLIETKTAVLGMQ